VVAVDHHASHVQFAHVTALDPTAPATAVLAAALVERLAVPLDERIASCLWVGLVTDTGSFRHASTTPGTLRLAARLLEAGAPGAALSRAVLDDIPAALLPVMGQAVSGSTVEPDALGGVGLVRAVIPLASREAAGLGVEDVAPVLDVVRRPREADVAVLLVGEAPDRWKLSLRSKGRVDVGRAAVALGGGGHRRAAGATVNGPLEVAERVVRDALEAVVAT
jgi:phosphoesterase RecJ-like protein